MGPARLLVQQSCHLVQTHTHQETCDVLQAHTLHVYMDGWREGHTVGADASYWVAADSVTTVTDRGTVEAKLQGGAAAVTAGKNRESSNYTSTANKKPSES